MVTIGHRVAGGTATWQGNNNESRSADIHADAVWRRAVAEDEGARKRRIDRARGFINRKNARRSSDTSADDGEKRATTTTDGQRQEHFSHLTRAVSYSRGDRIIKDARRSCREGTSREVFPPMIDER